MRERLLLVFNRRRLLVSRRDPPTIPHAGSFSPQTLWPDAASLPGRRGNIEYDSSEPDVDPDLDHDLVPDGFEFVPLRSMLSVLPIDQAEAATHAMHMLHWRSTTRFCGRCGTPMEDHPTETARTCPACNLIVYPRISPAIIVGVRRGDRLLLARNRRHTSPMYSIIAGFVEPGESLEGTVAREVCEEVSIEIENIRYFGSQPWPFPDSIMIGFLANHASGEIEVDGEEIVHADWYRPEDFPPIPPHGSISRRIIDRFASTYRSGRA